MIRINPQEIRPPSLEMSLEDIRDRENDLAGNLALNQELDKLSTINRWLELYGDAHPPLDSCKPMAIRTIKMRRETAWGLRYWSKFERSRDHYERLRSEGAAVTAAWLDEWRRLGPAFDRYPNDARYPEPE